MSIPSRVDIAIKRLQDFRSCLREEIRLKRQLEEKTDEMESDLSSNHNTIIELESQLHDQVQSLLERENEIKRLSVNMLSKDSLIKVLEEEILKLKNEIVEIRSHYEEEKQIRQKYLNDLKVVESNRQRLVLQEDSMQRQLVLVSNDADGLKEQVKQLEVCLIILFNSTTNKLNKINSN